MVRQIGIFGLEGLPMIEEGDDLAELIVAAAKRNGVDIEHGDVLIVAQKVVSKAEGRTINLNNVEPSRRAVELSKRTGRDSKLVELVLRESKRFLKASQQIIIVEDRRDIVNINAGIDKSNVEGMNNYTLLPEDPDESAKCLRSRIKEQTGKKVGVIISDSYSRAFRRGQVNFAIGLAGVDPFIDYRGKQDLFGYVLQVKFSAVADELAGAAELVMGQGREGVPVAIVRGLNHVDASTEFSSKDLIISGEEDLFRSVR
ncbi:MAG: coenzyme F420-0:L-glutamate ligase [Candidatus Bathyarchaeota archaeon]|nr:MAG: coenzyme F420-0:L-glutamate ligase [Candidatus Bathyarchaeota archaeon]